MDLNRLSMDLAAALEGARGAAARAGRRILAVVDEAPLAEAPT